MSDDPEEERREQLHRLRMWAAHGPSGGPEDPITVIKVHYAGDPPGLARFRLCRWSLAARLADDCRTGGRPGDTCEDLGPSALPDACLAARGDFAMGEQSRSASPWATGGLGGSPPAPVEPVPGSPGATAAGN